MSRNKNEKYKSLNWVITLLKNEKEVITCDYAAGIGHCPSYKIKGIMTVDKRKAIDSECETGFNEFGGRYVRTANKIKPNTLDVLYSIISDCDVVNYGGFENWANSLGYSDDSIKAKKIFDTCVETYLKLRNAIGENGIQKLQETFQDY